jgi:hypothetical protein
MGDAQDFGAGNEFTAIPEGQGGRAGGVVYKKSKYSDTADHLCFQAVESYVHFFIDQGYSSVIRYPKQAIKIYRRSIVNN